MDNSYSHMSMNVDVRVTTKKYVAVKYASARRLNVCICMSEATSKSKKNGGV